MSEEPVLPSQVRPGIPSGLEDIIRKCLSKALPGRYATMQEVLADLERVQKDLPRATSMDVVRSAELRRLVENGRNYMGKKQYDEALSRFDAALKLSPAEKQVISLRNETAKKLEEARQLNNLLREANTLYLRGKYDEAEDRLRAVSALDPQHPEAAELTAAIRKKREHLEGLDKLLTDAGFYLKHGKFEEAAACYRQVLAIDPENKDAARGLEKAGKKKKQKTKKEEAKTPVPRSGRPQGTIVRAGIILTIVCLVSGGIWSLFFHHRSQPEVSPQTPVADSTAIIGSLQQEAQSEKSRAAAAGAERWAPSLFDSAQQRLNEGENSAQSRAFGDAARLLGEAKSLFLSASEEAPKNEMASRANVEELTGMARDAREEMLKEKSAVDKMEGKREMPSRYAETSDQTEKAEALLAAGDRASLINARASFTRARDGYKKIRTEIDHLSDLRAGAESARARMAAAKRKVGGGDQEKKGNTAYLIALKSETNGERLFSSGEYHAAADTFAHASELFGMAESQTQVLHAPAKEPPPVNIAALKEPEKADPAAKEKDDRDAADKAVTRVVDSYKATIEQGRVRDLATLLDLSDDDQSGWSSFFKESTQRQVGIEEIQREVATDNARVSFKVKISYVNVKDNKQVAQPPFVNTWTMQRTGGGWKVVAHN
jgi:tetratricopeptide (TPR) repeat protein